MLVTDYLGTGRASPDQRPGNGPLRGFSPTRLPTAAARRDAAGARTDRGSPQPGVPRSEDLIGVAAQIAALLSGLSAFRSDPAAFAAEVVALRRLVLTAVPSCTDLALFLTLHRTAPDDRGTIELLAAHHLEDPVRSSSLTVQIPGWGVGDHLAAHATTPHAFDALVEEFKALPASWDLRVTADPPDPETDQALDRAAVDQALGVLLDLGWAPDRAAEELGRRAAADGVSRPAAARLILLAAIAARGPEEA